MQILSKGLYGGLIFSRFSAIVLCSSWSNLYFDNLSWKSTHELLYIPASVTLLSPAKEDDWSKSVNRDVVLDRVVAVQSSDNGRRLMALAISGSQWVVRIFAHCSAPSLTLSHKATAPPLCAPHIRLSRGSLLLYHNHNVRSNLSSLSNIRVSRNTLLTRSFALASSSMELWNMLLHLLDIICMLESVR